MPNAVERQTVIVRHDDGDTIELCGTGYAVRCAARIAEDNHPDARWALKVLNRYGHLVEHEADAPARAGAGRPAYTGLADERLMANAIGGADPTADSGKDEAPSPPAIRDRGNVIDLIEALRRSLARAEREPSAPSDPLQLRLL